jgi:hypothetical protein
MNEYLSLKWGTIKSYDHLTEKSQDIVKRYFTGNKPNADRCDILIELIDQFNGEIWDDWKDVFMTKDEAKHYIREYGQ